MPHCIVYSASEKKTISLPRELVYKWQDKVQSVTWQAASNKIQTTWYQLPGIPQDQGNYCKKATKPCVRTRSWQSLTASWLLITALQATHSKTFTSVINETSMQLPNCFPVDTVRRVTGISIWPAKTCATWPYRFCSRTSEGNQVLNQLTQVHLENHQ